MTEQEPTKEQIKELWEWCGFKANIGIPSGRILNWWLPEDAILVGELPIIDLNNLFKYAVPKVMAELMVSLGCDEKEAIRFLFSKWLERFNKGYSFQNALFWAIWEVIHDNR